MWEWIIGLGVVTFVAVAVAQYRAQRGTYRSLSSRQPGPRSTTTRPLGMEAMDLDEVRSTQRRNESLERAGTSLTPRTGFFGLMVADTDIRPMADDETYAKRFHTAFQRDNRDKDKQ